MSTYATLGEIKGVLGITDSSKDTVLQMYLDAAEDVINRYIGVDTLLSSEVTERIKQCDAIVRLDGVKFFVNKRPVTAINKIEGIAYAGTIGITFVVENQRGIVIKDITTYLLGAKFETFEVKYQAGLSTVPPSIKMATISIASGMFLGGGTNSAYQSYAIGEEKVVFKSSDEYKTTLSALDQFKVYK